MSRFNKILTTALLLLILVASGRTNDPASDYKLYFLGGQSNMSGYGFVRELPNTLLTEAPRVLIFTGRPAADNARGGGTGVWEPLRPGHGTGFDTDGRANALTNRFGPELMFGRTMADLAPGSRIALVKYARDSTSLQAGASGYGNWDPEFAEGDGINQFDHARTAIRNAFSTFDIDGDGRRDRLVPAGIIWMQGEADALHSRAAAEAYEANLKRLMDHLRATLRVGELPVVVGKITDSGMAADGSNMDHIDIVQRAQESFARNDACASFVTITDELDYLDDGWHYDTDGFLRLGAAFAKAVHALEASCPSPS
jgi:hypothetical protein